MFAISIACAALLASSASAAEGANFTYDTSLTNGPEGWKDIEFEDGSTNSCGGDANSPIALSTAKCDMFADYEFQGGNCTFKDFGFVIDHAVEQVNAPEAASGLCQGSSMKIPGVDGEFEMLQFHLHTNSEHTFEGMRFGAELHIVHKEIDSDRLAVVGMFITPTSLENNDIFSHMLAEFDAVTDAAYEACDMTAPPHWWQASAVDEIEGFPEDVLNAYDLIPEGSTFYNYDGGLTTPPCTEIVEWNVVDMPVEITLAQYTDLTSLILNYIDPDTCEFATIADPLSGSTSRPVQALNDRTVSRICPVGFMDEFQASTNNGNNNSATDAPSSTSTSASSKHQHVSPLIVFAAIVFSAVVTLAN